MRRTVGQVLVGLVVALAAVGVVGVRADAAPATTRVVLHLGRGTAVFSSVVEVRFTVEQTATARPTGTVTLLRDGDVPVASMPLRASAVPRGTGTFWVRSLPAGRSTLVAVYSGDGRYAAQRSDPLDVRVGPAETMTTLRSLKTSVATGTVAKLTARVTPREPATAVPTGSVTFKAGTVVRSVPLVDGVATWKPKLPDGLYDVVAVFEGGDSWEGSHSDGHIRQRIGPIPVPEVDQSVTSTSGRSVFIAPGGTFPAAAQVFTAGVTGTITAVELDHGCMGGGLPGPGFLDVPISIKALDGSSPTGASLGTGATATGYDDSTGLTRVDLTTPAPVTKGTRYAIVLAAPQGGLGCQLGLAADGESLVQLGQGWTTQSGSLRFTTWVLRP